MARLWALPNPHTILGVDRFIPGVSHLTSKSATTKARLKMTWEKSSGCCLSKDVLKRI